MIYSNTESKELKTKKNLPSKVSIQNGRRDTVPDKPKLKKFITTKSALKEMFRDLFKWKRKTVTRNRKIIKEKNPTGKDKYTEKVVEQLPVEQV